MRSPHPSLTVSRTLVPGEALRAGGVRAYRAVAIAPGEAHVLRDELTKGALPVRESRRRPVIAFAHATDLQLADVQSPTRFEFCNRYVDDPRFRRLVPMHRPQEALAARATQAMVRTLNSLTCAPATRAELALVLTTGDAIDNAQWNELQMFLALFEGGTVRPGSGGPHYEGVQALGWGDDTYWRPDGTGRDASDWYQDDYGFPHLPGLLDRALEDFRSTGLQLPWLACFGNHEVLAQGVGRVTEEVRQHLVGASKPTGPLTGLDLDTLHDVFVESPERFLSGRQQQVTPDADRRAVTRQQFIDAHFSALSKPWGHGFTAENRRAGTAYYSYDVGAVRFICLDSTMATGSSDGCLDEDQARWLRQRLEEVHASYVEENGTTVRTGRTDRLVIVFSHHGADTMINNTRNLQGTPTAPRLMGGSELSHLLHRFDNVVAWVNGHTHQNRVTPRPDPSGRGSGFWEIATSALMDWPSQARLVEVVDNDDGTVSLICTMVDHDGLVRPEAELARTGQWLAGLHRELAANEPWRGFVSGGSGGLVDRNVDLRLPRPFPLRGSS